MQFISRITGLKALEKRFESLTRPEIIENARQQTLEDIRKFKTRPSSRFINHVFRGFLGDELRRRHREKG
jgi:hypothetical protein